MGKYCLGALVGALISLSAAAAGLPTDLARGHGVTAGGHGAWLTNGVSSQVDCGAWAAVVWDQEYTIDRLIIDITKEYVIASYVIQVPVANLGRAANPADDNDWVDYHYSTVYDHTDFARDFCVKFDNITTSGVRLLVLDGQNPAGDLGNARISGIWAWTNYNNIAPQATFSVNKEGDEWNWANPASWLNDETMTGQVYANMMSGSPYIYAKYDTAVTIDAFMVACGGGRALYEVLGGIALEYWDEELDAYVPVLGGAVTNNTGGVVHPDIVGEEAWMIQCEFDAVTAQYWRFHITDIGNNSGDLARISEIMMFGVIPEPVTMSLLALGGLALLRRRR